MIDRIKALARARKIKWKKHALKRMLERGISREKIFKALYDFQIVEEHDIQRPLQTCLVLGYYKSKPLHIMLAVDDEQNVLWVITVYEPSNYEWQEDFKARRE